MKLQIETDSYNGRRYGKPWIAKVSFASGAKGDFQFGEWCGNPEEKGLLILECEVGDIIALGQKDFRKPANSAPSFYLVGEDGARTPIKKPDAYKHWNSLQRQPA